MHRDHDAGFRGHRPHAVVGGVAGGAGRARHVDRRGPHADEARAQLDGPRQIGFGRGRVEQREHGAGLDAAVAVVAPIVVEPRVVGAEDRVERVRVVEQHLFEPESEARQQPRELDALLVHLRDPCGVLSVLGPDRLHLHEVAHRGAFEVLRPEVAFQRSGRADRVVRRVRDDRHELAVHDQRAPPLDVGPAHEPAELAREMARERVLRLVVVLVGVVDRVVDVQCGRRSLESRHGSSFRAARGSERSRPIAAEMIDASVATISASVAGRPATFS